MMKTIEQIKKELQDFGFKYDASPMALDAIKGNSLKELFENINEYIDWCKSSSIKKKAFNAIFDNELVIEDGMLLFNCSNTPSVIIPESVTSIEKDAFYGCRELTSIIIPNSVTSIGEGAFMFCTGLTSITIPNSITSIGKEVFAFCSGLTSITIPDSVTSIGKNIFYGCKGLTSIEIPNSVVSIINSVFFGCSGDLKIITL